MLDARHAAPPLIDLNQRDYKPRLTSKTSRAQRLEKDHISNITNT